MLSSKFPELQSCNSYSLQSKPSDEPQPSGHIYRPYVRHKHKWHICQLGERKHANSGLLVLIQLRKPDD